MSTSFASPAAILQRVQLAQVFAVCPLPLAVVDVDWRVSRANPAWISAFGEPGRSWIDLIHPLDLVRDLPLFGRVQTGALPTFRSQVRILAEGGGWTAVALAVSALSSSCDDVLLTVLSQEEQTATTSSGEAGDLRHITAALSHDVLQHARLVSAYGSLLQRTVLDARQVTLLGVACDHAERLQVVLASLVRWLRMAEHQPQRLPCDLSALCQAASEGLDADVTIGDLPTVTGDPQLLGELLRELMLNAVRYHGGRARITVSAARDGLMWELCLADDGPGIPAKHRERMLLPLQRLHSWEEVAGHGMGLALAARIARCHGGGLCVAEETGGGCRVRVRLPT
jgi:signal transduction histidine kinase